MKDEQGVEVEETDEESIREAGAAAVKAGRYAEAMTLLLSGLVTRAVRFFAEEGLTFHRRPGEFTPIDLLVGLTSVAKDELIRRGEQGSAKLLIATSVLEAVAEFRIALENADGAAPANVEDRVARLIFLSASVGTQDAMTAMVEAGFLDRIAAYEIERDRKRLGATKTNTNKDAVRQTALNAALAIVAKNPTLDNEDLAQKILANTGLPRKVRTVTAWVREWRAKDYIAECNPAQR